MTFTEQAKEQAQASWQGSFQHPFITELHEGTLSPTIFRYYLIQDHYYLKHFSQLYRLIAAQTQQPRLKKLLLTNAENLALGELAIRETFFEELAITEEEVAATPIAPTAYHYVSHMYRQLIEGTPKTAAASMLPCSWLYQEIGAQLVKQHSPEPLYQRWIETYAGEEAYQHVQEERQLLDQLYEESSPQEQAAMITAFVISSEMEYAFWKMAHTHETWIG
ncbi:TPA: thiaminase II [Enterococcus faecalis]|uniref:thiaminase II n=1 Tax=Enterococcus faecalis TaxID=1351 RepID=UPI001C282CD5|nr:thiaminase II [Enterococcus faecalis]HBG9536177.1 thiaminase II [Enterococcus faecalis]